MDRRACITAFVRVAEYSGFSAAARCLNVSTTTVSDQIQALENALGVRLLNRTTRRVSLTVVGREYYERCAQILQELTEADEAANASQMTPRGRLRVYCHQGLGRFIALVATRFLKEDPEVLLDLRTGDAMIDLVEEGFDLAIMPSSPTDSTLIKRTLAKWHHLLCCTPAYLETHSAPRPVEPLQQIELLLRFRPRTVIKAAARNPEQRTLPGYGQPRFQRDHRPPLSTREMAGCPARKSRSTCNCPILRCRSSITFCASSTAAALLPRANNSLARFTSSCFQLLIIIG
jgi:DNA-binding transcriptional LysR family regulator